jgi:SAM-dependent methyltransferase
VQVHPVSSLGLSRFGQLSASKGARMDQPTQELQLELKLGDAAQLPWPDGAFTVALSANTFFFLQQPELVLAELHRVISPGGRVVIGTVPGPLPTPSLRNWWVWVWGSRMHVYDDESMRSMLDAAGFAEVAVTRSSRSAEPLQLVRAVRR